MAMLLEKRRLQIDRDFWEWFLKSREDLVLAEAPLTWNVAREFSLTMLAHGDPGDRLLLATAKVYNLTLVTADEKLMSVPGVGVLPNR
jgi:PIN domain nuclease of toxin-antitoxin system